MDPDPTPDPTPLYNDFKNVRKNNFFRIFFVYFTHRYVHHFQSKKLNFLLKYFLVEHYFSLLNLFMWQEKDPDPYIWLLDPGGPKTCGSSSGSGSPTLVPYGIYIAVIREIIKLFKPCFHSFCVSPLDLFNLGTLWQDHLSPSLTDSYVEKRLEAACEGAPGNHWLYKRVRQGRAFRLIKRRKLGKEATFLEYYLQCVLDP